MFLDNLLLGASNVVMPMNLLAIFGGTALGMFVGSMPGLSATMAIALLVPVTYVMSPATGLCMLASLYMGSMYGGSIAAILICTPGTPSAAATTLDGYPMAQRGEAGRALGISLTASFVGGVISSVVLLTIAPLLGRIAVLFGPVELFGVAVLGMTILASLSQGSTIKGLLSGATGLILATVGMDSITGIPRFAMGNINLFSGIPFTVALIGLFSIPQALRLIETDEEKTKGVVGSVKDKILRPWSELKALSGTFLRSSLIGIFTGIIPGTGGDTACWFAYNEAKRRADNPQAFGTGSIYGVAAPEAANNAVVGGALIPTITLGIPGSSATAVLMGGLMIHGIMPGPTLMIEHADVTYTLLWAVLLSNFVMFLEGVVFTRMCVCVTRVGNRVLAVAVVILCVIGAFAINNSFFDVTTMLLFGVLGYFMAKVEVPVAPMVVGLILGRMLEVSLRQSLLMSRGSWMIFLRNPICAALLLLALLSLIQATPAYMRWRASRRAARP